MSTGVYGIQRPADINPALDAEVYYHYTKDRNSIGNNELIKLDASEVLIKTNEPNRSDPSQFELMGGCMTLKLPKDQFANLGFYTVIIRNRQCRIKILDCGVLSSNPSIRGIVLDLAQVPTDLLSNFENNALTGFRIEYLNTVPSNDAKISSYFTIITSNNRCEPVLQNLNSSNEKSISYRLNDSSTLIFCTLSPSSASNIRPNALPYIGSPNQEIIITNTKFNPQIIEIETVEHDASTLAIGLFSNQSKSLSDGIYTIYNKEKNIFRQYDLYEIQDQYSGKPLFEIKSERVQIDFSKSFDNITNI